MKILSSYSLLILISIAIFINCSPFNVENISLSKLQNILKKYLSNFLIQNNYPGLAISVDIPNMGSFNISEGFSDLQYQVEMNGSNHFRIASISKTFTGIAILQLYDQNLLSLNDTVTKYITNQTIPNGNTSTIYQLLHMTTGIPEYTDIYYNPISNITPFEILALIENEKPQFESGTQWNYCNTNYVILGLIVEKISNLTLPEYITVNIIQKYNLQNTYYPNTPYINIPYSHGYLNVSGIPNITQLLPSQWSIVGSLSFVDATYYNPQAAYGCGAMISTITDLTQWAKLLFEAQILSPKGQVALMDYISTNSSEFNIAYQGGSVEGYTNNCGGKLVGKTGGIFGFNSLILLDMNTNITAVMYMNYLIDSQPIILKTIDSMCIVLNFVNSMQKSQNPEFQSNGSKN